MVDWLIDLALVLAWFFRLWPIWAPLLIAWILIDMHLKAKKREAESNKGPQPAPLEQQSAEYRYNLWRKELRDWADNDGTDVGLQTWLDRWRDIPHEKPKAKGNDRIQQLVDDMKDWGLLAPDPKPTTFYAERDDCYCGCPTSRQVVGCKCSCHHGPEITWKSNVFQIAPPTRFKVGDYVRYMYGNQRLYRVTGFESDGFVRVEDEGSKCGSLHPSCLSPAIPRYGEWWRWTRNTCPERALHHGQPRMFQVPEDKHLDTLKDPTIWYEVCSGCLEPVNFGRGWEATG